MPWPGAADGGICMINLGMEFTNIEKLLFCFNVPLPIVEI